jgi:hypothetical protein
MLALSSAVEGAPDGGTRLAECVRSMRSFRLPSCGLALLLLTAASIGTAGHAQAESIYDPQPNSRRRSIDRGALQPLVSLVTGGNAPLASHQGRI